jgi:hypothetical protein
MKKYSFLTIFTVFFALIGCNESDNTIDEVLNHSSGGFLRTVQLNGVTVATAVNNADVELGNNASSFNVLLEAYDNNNGQDLAKVDVYFQYQNRTEGPTPSTQEVFFSTITNFDMSSYLPRINFSTTLGQVLSHLNVNGASINGGDRFAIVFKYVMKDGRVFTYNNSNSNVIGGAAIRSPFRYFLNVA